MKAKFDHEEFELPDRAVVGLRDFLSGVAQGMILANPEEAHCWTWGRAYVGDICSSRSIQFQWGGDGDWPDDDESPFAVLPLPEKNSD